MKYTLGEVRKSVEAGAGLAYTVVAYVLADEYLRTLVPPQWIALATGLVAVYRVFKVPNAKAAPSIDTAAADVDRALAAIQAAHTHAAAATDVATSAVKQARELETALTSGVGQVVGTLANTIDRAIAEQAADVNASQ